MTIATRNKLTIKIGCTTMNFNKSLVSAAVAAALTGALAAPAQAVIIDMSYSGLFTMLDPTGVPLANTSNPYYSDPTWRYGLRTPISGTMQFNTDNGFGTGTVAPFQFFNGGAAIASGISFQSIGGGLMLGNMNFSWNGSDITTNIVLNGSGLFAEMGTIAVNDVYDATTCAISGACALPASNGIKGGTIPIGAAPIATSTFNVAGDTGFGVTLGQLSLGVDDGIGGSPMSNGPFATYNANFDMSSVTVTGITASAVPVPAAVWLFGSGLLGLVGVARRRKQA